MPEDVHPIPDIFRICVFAILEELIGPGLTGLFGLVSLL